MHCQTTIHFVVLETKDAPERLRMEAASENVDRLAMIAVSGIIFSIALKILNPGG